MKNSIKKSLIMGGAFAIAAIFAASFLNHGTYSETILLLALVAIASALSGFVMWWSFVASREQSTYLRCVLTGIATVVVSHFLTCQLIAFGLEKLHRYGSTSSLTENFQFGLFAGLMSLVLIGWMTIPLGVLFGYLGRDLEKYFQTLGD